MRLRKRRSLPPAQVHTGYHILVELIPSVPGSAMAALISHLISQEYSHMLRRCVKNLRFHRRSIFIDISPVDI